MVFNMKELNIASIFKDDADELIQARIKSIKIHNTSDIRAAGNEVENSVRDYFIRILPKKYYITHGHIIDNNGIISPEIDIIISDNDSLPSLMKTKDGTEYIPIDSVYAIGEIKSTYYKNKHYIQDYSEKIKIINNDLYHELNENTAYNGVFNSNTSMRDIILEKGNRYLNNIYKFIIFIDKNDFDFHDISQYYNETKKNDLPNLLVILNFGIISFGTINNEKVLLHRYPEEIHEENSHWYFCPFVTNSDEGSIEGNILGYLYYTLLLHLTNSYLEPPSLHKYVSKMFIIKKSMMLKEEK